MATLLPDSPLHAILADPNGVALTIGREAATELGIAALEHLEGDPEPRDVQALVMYAARHDESAPARDALVAILLNASGTLRAPLAPYCGADVVAARVRTAVNYRGDYARIRLAGYLARLTPGTAWYEAMREIVEPPAE